MKGSFQQFNYALISLVLLTLVSLSSTLVGGAHAIAEDAHNPGQFKEKISDKMHEVRENSEARVDVRREDRCERQENIVKRIFNNSADRTARHIKLFSKIQNRVEAFYTNKNLSVSNYQGLVDIANQKKQLAENASHALKDQSLNCRLEGGNAQQLRDILKTAHQAVKDYRTSIKNLLAAIQQSRSIEGAK